MKDYTDPADLAAKIDWEGWPDALEWFSDAEFEDQDLQDIIDKALDAYILLDEQKNLLDKKLEEMGVSV